MQNELKHYGVKGMKWGVRRYQNEDGTLTNFGKERIYTDAERKMMFKKEKANSGNGLVAQFKRLNEIPKDENEDLKMASGLLQKQSKIVSDSYEEYSALANRDFKKLTSDPKFKEDMVNKMDDLYKDIYEEEIDENPDYARYQIYKLIGDKYYSSMSQDTKNAYQKYYSNDEQYKQNVKAVVNDFVGKYGDKKIGYESYDSNVKKAIEKSFGDKKMYESTNNSEMSPIFKSDYYLNVEDTIYNEWRNRRKSK